MPLVECPHRVGAREASLKTPIRTFLLTPFSPEAAGEDAETYERVQAELRGAAEDAGVELVRADDIFESGKIVEQIHEQLEEADLVVAVCTGRNSNVYYELGAAIQMGHRPILIAASKRDLAFDMQDWRCQMYGHESGLDDLRHRVAKALKESAALANPKNPDPTSALAFVDKRLDIIRRDVRSALPVPIVGPFRLTVHVVPVPGEDRSTAVDVTSRVAEDPPKPISAYVGRDTVAPPLVLSRRPNVDGFAVWERYANSDVLTTPSYVQVFRDGALEAVDCNTGFYTGMPDDLQSVSADGLRDRVSGGVRAYVAYGPTVGMEPPLLVVVTCQGLAHPHEPDNMRELVISDLRAGRFDRPTIQAPPQLILAVGEVESALKQILDVLFQAAGLADSSI